MKHKVIGTFPSVKLNCVQIVKVCNYIANESLSVEGKIFLQTFWMSQKHKDKPQFDTAMISFIIIALNLKKTTILHISLFIWREWMCRDEKLSCLFYIQFDASKTIDMVFMWNKFGYKTKIWFVEIRFSDSGCKRDDDLYNKENTYKIIFIFTISNITAKSHEQHASQSQSKIEFDAVKCPFQLSFCNEI